MGKVNLSLIGFYEKGEPEPTYDPGLDVDCILCGQPLTAPTRTVRFVPVGGMRQCFYRTHQACADEQQEAEIKAAVPVSMLENAEAVRAILTEGLLPLWADVTRAWHGIVRGISWVLDYIAGLLRWK